MSFKRLGTGFSIITITAGLMAGCSGRSILQRNSVPVARNAEELGSVNLSVVSVSRWQDVAGSMETNFEKSNDDLLRDAVPQTSTVAERILDIATFSLAADIAGTQIDRSRSRIEESGTQSTTDAGGVTVITGTGSSTSKNSETRTRKTPAAPSELTLDSLAGKTPSSATFTPGDPTIDSFTQYRAAAALKQELVGLNRAVKDAAQRTGYEPLLVRVQFSMMPRRRQQPFDTRLRVSFLPDGLSKDETILRRPPRLTSLRSRDVLEANKPDDASRYGDFKGKIGAHLDINEAITEIQAAGGYVYFTIGKADGGGRRQKRELWKLQLKELKNRPRSAAHPSEAR